MSKINDGGPAFPEFGERGKACGGEGMTLRDYFAAQALAGWLASFAPDAMHPAGRGKEGDVAEMSYALADAMLRAREVNE